MPTAIEAGLADFEVTSWQAVMAPGGMAPALLERVHAAVAGALRHPETARRLEQIGLAVVASAPEEYAAFQRAEIARWRQVVERGGRDPAGVAGRAGSSRRPRQGRPARGRLLSPTAAPRPRRPSPRSRSARWAGSAARRARHHKAGAASALIGAMHSGAGVLSAAMVGWFADGTPWTMAGSSVRGRRQLCGRDAAGAQVLTGEMGHLEARM